MNHLDEAYTLAAHHKLDAQQTAQLAALAAPAPSADFVRLWFWRAVAALAAALGGFGVVMWVAANWKDFGRFGRFGLLEVFVLVMSVGAAWILRRESGAFQASADLQALADSKGSLTAPAMGMAALLGIGALFAYFGQTYQTGADPWQLFALWAVVALPLCFALRSDLLWMPWVIVASTGVALWLSTHSEHSWYVKDENFRAFAVACLVGALIVVSVSSVLKYWTGAGVWSLRTALTIYAISLVSSAVMGLLGGEVAPQYYLALSVMLALGTALTRRKLFDVYLLSVVSLAGVILLLAGLGHLLFTGSTSDWFASLLLLAFAAAGMLAGLVRLILSLSKKYANISGDAR